MSDYSQNDIERLVREQRIDPEAFRAILDDPAAIEDVARLVQTRELFKPPQTSRAWRLLKASRRPTLVALHVLGFVALTASVYLKWKNVMIENANYQQQITIHSLDGTLAGLEQLGEAIDISGLTRLVKLPDPPANVFRVVGPERNRIEVEGEINPKFIQEVRLYLGTEGTFTSLYKGVPEPKSSPTAEFTSFFGSSPELKLNGDPIIVTLAFVPNPDMSKRFAQFFTSDKLQYSRNFLLARDGIQADPELVVISSPRDGDAVEQHCQLDGQVSVKDGYPVVFIKPPTGNSWWVQDPATVTDDAFSASLNVGNETSPAGTKFRIVVAVARSMDEARKFKPGMEMSSLPPGLIRSSPITVIRQ